MDFSNQILILTASLNDRVPMDDVELLDGRVSVFYSPVMSSLIINDTGTVFSRWAYRAVFCSQYGFAAIPTFFVFFMPEYVRTIVV